IYSGSSPTDAWSPPTNCNGFHFDPLTGEINFKAKKQDFTVMCFKVDQWHKNSSGIYKNIGSVTRQTGVAVISCPTNNIPTLTGIDSGKSYSTTICFKQAVKFKIIGFDPDTKDTMTMVWDN